jgi:hypothetical protein
LVAAADDARRGDFADLVTTEYPQVRLSDMTLAPATRAQLERVLDEQRQRGLLESRGLAPLRRLLLTGPAGTGKSMTASALAAELSLPLVTIQIDALISKYTGDTTAKLPVVFDAVARHRAVCLFHDLDAIGARQMSVFEFGIVDARSVLNMFLSFLDNTQPESLVVTVTDHRSLLDDALLRRFDAVIPYALPDADQALGLLRERLAAMDTATVSWTEVAEHVRGLSQAGLIRAADSNSNSVSTAALVTSLGELHRAHHPVGFGIDTLRSRPNQPSSSRTAAPRDIRRRGFPLGGGPRSEGRRGRLRVSVLGKEVWRRHLGDGRLVLGDRVVEGQIVVVQWRSESRAAVGVGRDFPSKPLVEAVRE